jgi:hypothetical protein
MDPQTVSQLVVAGIGALAGYLIKHYGLFGSSTASAVATPSPSSGAPATSQSFLALMLKDIEAQLIPNTSTLNGLEQLAQQYLIGRIQGTVTPPTPAASPAAPTTKA